MTSAANLHDVRMVAESDMASTLAGATSQGKPTLFHLPSIVHASDSSLGRPNLTIIVPTRNEADNVAQLVNALEAVLPDTVKEIIFVDDSDDATPTVIQGLPNNSPYTSLAFIHRQAGQRSGGLGSAVVLGLRSASAPWVCVMDADLQHPPELVPQLLAKATSANLDVVVGSRYRDSGDAGGLNFVRKGISQSFDTIARLAFPEQLAEVSDPMSGFFMVRKAAIELEELHPRGFKILLEILVRSGTLRTAEIPFHFGVRQAGESKAGVREATRYLLEVLELRLGENTARFLRFALTGLSGLFVNLLLQFLFTDLFGLHYLAAAVISTQGSTLWNFMLTENWVFADRLTPWNRLYRMIMFFMINNAALTIRGPIMFTLTSGLGMHYLASNLLSLLAFTLIRYTLADSLIWKNARDKRLSV